MVGSVLWNDWNVNFSILLLWPTTHRIGKEETHRTVAPMMYNVLLLEAVNQELSKNNSCKILTF